MLDRRSLLLSVPAAVLGGLVAHESETKLFVAHGFADRYPELWADDFVYLNSGVITGTAGDDLWRGQLVYEDKKGNIKPVKGAVRPVMDTDMNWLVRE